MDKMKSTNVFLLDTSELNLNADGRPNGLKGQSIRIFHHLVKWKHGLHLSVLCLLNTMELMQ